MQDVPGLNEMPGENPGGQNRPGEKPAASPSSTPASQPIDFDMNRPTIISLCYLGSFITGISGLVGVILAYVWRSEPQADWQASHYQYLINTFWIGFLGAILSIVLMVVLVGFLLLAAVTVLVVIRSVLSMVNAQKQMPMPNPGTWLA